MNQYFILKQEADGRYSILDGRIKKDDNGRPRDKGFETFDQARQYSNGTSGNTFVVKHYTQDDYRRDYERGES